MNGTYQKLNITQYQYLIRSFLPPSKQDFLLIKVTVPIILVSAFVIVLLLLYLKCGKKTKRSKVKRVASVGSRADGTVKSAWRNVRFNNLSDRKLPPIPEEQSECVKAKNVGSDREEEEVYAEIDSAEETDRMTKYNKVERPKALSIPNPPDLVNDYLDLVPAESPEPEHKDLEDGLYSPYIYPCQDFSPKLRDFQDRNPYHATDFCGSSPISLYSAMSNQTWTYQQTKDAWRLETGTFKLADKATTEDKTDEALTKSYVCRKCSTECSPAKNMVEGKIPLRESRSLDSEVTRRTSIQGRM